MLAALFSSTALVISSRRWCGWSTERPCATYLSTIAWDLWESWMDGKKNKKKKHSNNWNKNQNFMKHPTDQPHVPPQPFGQLRYTCPATSILAGQKGWKQEFSRTMSRGVVLESLRDSLYFPVKDALKHITFQFRTGIAHRNRRPMLVGKWHEAAHRPASYPTHPFWIITKHIFSSFNPVRSKGEKTRFSQEPWGVVLESCLGWLVSSKAYSETHYASIQNRNWT